MRACILFVGFIIAFASCNKDDNNDSTKVYNDSKGTSLSISFSKWFISTYNDSAGGFFALNLIVSGSTNADRITMETYNGLTQWKELIGEHDVLLDSNKSFKKDTIGIAFVYYSGTQPTGAFATNTVITAYKGLDTLAVTLNSGTLNY